MHRLLSAAAPGGAGVLGRVWRRRAPFVFFALVLAVGGCESGPTSSTPSGASPVEAASTVQVGTIAVPLPEGSWREVLTREEAFKAGRGSSTRKVLARVRDGVVERLVLIHVVDAGSGEAFREQKACARDTYYYQTITERGQGIGDCWHVRFANFGLAGDPHWLSEDVDGYLRRERLSMSVVMLGVRFVRHAGPTLVQVEYLWNPDLVLAPKERVVWLPPDWQNPAVRARPDRRAVMETLKQWGQNWHPMVVGMLPF
jgi:hypothetical protein